MVRVLRWVRNGAAAVLVLELALAVGVIAFGQKGYLGGFLGAKYFAVRWTIHDIQVHAATGFEPQADRDQVGPWLRSLDIRYRDPVAVEVPGLLKVYRYEPGGLVMYGLSWQLLCAVPLLVAVVCHVLGRPRTTLPDPGSGAPGE
jgi:hypothetical protein